MCEHSEIGLILIVPSAHGLNPRPPCIYSGRADNACTNLLGFLVRYVRSRGIAETVESGKTTDFRSVLCRTYSPRMARATNSCTPRWSGRRTARVLLADFWYLSSLKSTIKEKLLYVSIRRQQATALRTKPKHNQQTKQKICFPFRQRTCQAHARRTFICGRADNACTNLLGFLV